MLGCIFELFKILSYSCRSSSLSVMTHLIMAKYFNWAMSGSFISKKGKHLLLETSYGAGRMNLMEAIVLSLEICIFKITTRFLSIINVGVFH